MAAGTAISNARSGGGKCSKPCGSHSDCEVDGNDCQFCCFWADAGGKVCSKRLLGIGCANDDNGILGWLGLGKKNNDGDQEPKKKKDFNAASVNGTLEDILDFEYKE